MTTTSPTTAEACAVLAALHRLTITTITAAHLEAACARTAPGDPAYRVRVGPGRRWACSCPRAVYGGRRGEPCKHAAALRLLAGALPEPMRGDWT